MSLGLRTPSNVKRLLPFLASFALAACGGVVSSPQSGVTTADGGTVCLVPTVVGLRTPSGAGPASAVVDVDLGEVAAGLDSVVLASVHLRPASGPGLDFVEGARLSVESASGVGTYLAGGGFVSDGGLLLSLPEAEVDVKALSTGSSLPVRLELEGRMPAEPLSLLLEVCVNKGNTHYSL
jgi:hypothetical protein